MNITAGSGGSTKAFNTGGQNAYWYLDATWPTGSSDATIAAGNYTFNMYFANRPGAGSGDILRWQRLTPPPRRRPARATPQSAARSPGGRSSYALRLLRREHGRRCQLARVDGVLRAGRPDQYAALAVAGAWRKADGTEGSSITVTTNLSVLAAHHAYRITGAADPTVRPPEAATIGYTDTTTSIDPPSLSPTGGAKDYLWLAVAGYRRSGRTMTGTPTSYTNLLDVNSGHGRHASMRRQLNAASETPAPYTQRPSGDRSA
jgi:hypothetical protein